jgi:hypothetical protein
VEALLFTFSSVLMVVLAYMAWHDDRRPPGTPPTNIFRTADKATAPEIAAKPGWKRDTTKRSR